MDMRGLRGARGVRGAVAVTLAGALALAPAVSSAQMLPEPVIKGPIIVGPWLKKDLSVEKIEITQSQQFMNSSGGADNSLPAVDRRTTTVRATIKVTSILFPGSVSGVQGRLRVFQGATLLYDMLADNGPITAVVSPNRDNASHTLNFTFLPETAGILALFGRTLTFTVTVDPFSSISESNEGNNESSLSKFFGCRRAPLVMGIPIDYSAATEPDPSTLGTPAPNLIGQGVGDAFLWGAYPFPEYEPGASGRYRLVDGPAFAWASNIDSSGSALLTDLNTLRAGMSPMPDFIYGWFRGNPFSGNGLGQVGGTAAFGNTDPTRHQRTFAHEVGHNFGFTHNRGDAGLFITNINDTGWDTLDRVNLGVLKASTLKDIMVPGLLTHEAWVHPRTYRDVHDGATDSCFVINWPVIELISISALIPPRPGDPWQVMTPFQIRSVAPAPQPRKEGRGRARLLSAEGKEIYVTAFDVRSPGDSEREQAEGPQALGLTLPASPEVAVIELHWEGQSKQVWKRSPSAPAVDITRLQVVGEDLMLGWKAEDKDGDKLEAIVRYSPDGGQSFVPLAVRPRGNDLRLSLRGLPASAKGTLELLVSDGMNTTVAKVEGLAVGKNQPPVVALVRPHQGDVFPAGANVVMLASTHDPEDGGIAHDKIVWTSDRDGQQGVGAGLNTAALSAGSHHLQVTATDSQGASSSAAVDIAIR